MKNKQSIILFGVGRMGVQIAKRLHTNNFNISAWNRSLDSEFVQDLKKSKIYTTNKIHEVIEKCDSPQRIFWVMLPHQIVDEFIFGKENLGQFLRKGDIVIDGGNSFYKDSMRRSKELSKRGIYFFDSGTSGGIWGEKEGFALMVGGSKAKWPLVEPIFKALSNGRNYGYLGVAGAGHFTKMVHNAIEYGMMEAIGEGYALLDASPFKLNMKDVTRIYSEGSVVRSWLIDLCKDIFEKENIKKTIGQIDSNGEGEWALKIAKEFGVDVRVMKESVKIRKESMLKQNQEKFSNKIVALLRKQFGGHRTYFKK